MKYVAIALASIVASVITGAVINWWDISLTAIASAFGYYFIKKKTKYYRK
jgi:hypothetical protein